MRKRTITAPPNAPTILCQMYTSGPVVSVGSPGLFKAERCVKNAGSREVFRAVSLPKKKIRITAYKAPQRYVTYIASHTQITQTRHIPVHIHIVLAE